MNIKWIGSPNFDTNRKPIKKIIVHWMVGSLAGTDAVFQDDARDTSAHYGIENGVIHQYVKEENVAYHAGNYVINQESIGIEHSASPDRPASDETYLTSGRLIKEICERYNIPIDLDHIEPHNKYRATACPGTMDINRLISIAREETSDMYRDYNLNDKEDIKRAIDLLKDNERVSAEKSIQIVGLVEDLDELTSELDDYKSNLKICNNKNAQIKLELEACENTPVVPPLMPPTPIETPQNGILDRLSKFLEKLGF